MFSKTNAKKELTPNKAMYMHRHLGSSTCWTRHHSMHTKTPQKSRDFPFVAGESLSHNSQHGCAWPRPLSRPANPLRHSSSGHAGPQPALPRLPSVPPLIGRSPSRERRTSSTDQQHRSSENQKNTGTLEGKKETGRRDVFDFFSRPTLTSNLFPEPPEPLAVFDCPSLVARGK